MDSKKPYRIKEIFDGDSVTIRKAQNGFIVEYDRSLDYDPAAHPELDGPAQFFHTVTEVYEGEGNALVDALYSAVEALGEYYPLEIKERQDD